MIQKHFQAYTTFKQYLLDLQFDMDHFEELFHPLTCKIVSVLIEMTEKYKKRLKKQYENTFSLSQIDWRRLDPNVYEIFALDITAFNIDHCATGKDDLSRDGRKLVHHLCTTGLKFNFKNM